jgi:H+/Cl- antiporter ClcA
LHSRHHHRLAYTGIACGVLLIIGLIALNFPVFLDAYDQWGFQIKCGTGYVADLAQAASSVGQRNYVDKCETALLLRRLWAIPLVAVSGLIVLAVTVASAVASARESFVPHRDTA